MREQLEKLEADAQDRRQPAVLSGDAARSRSRRSAANSAAPACCSEDNGAWRRLVVEKPFGTDLASAQGAERRTAEDRRRAPDLPDRSLSRQGDGAEHPGAALRQRHVRADLESQSHRSRPDHGRREARRRPSRQLLRRHRRAARHGAEPSVPAAVAGGDGAAERASMRIRCARKRPRCSRRSRPRARRRRCRIRCAASICAGKIGDDRDRGLSQDRGRQARQHHRNLCRAETDHRQLALGRRAVLSAHRQGARHQAHRGRDQVQAGAVRDVPLHAGRPAVAELSRHRHRADRRHHAAVQHQGAGPDDHDRRRRDEVPLQGLLQGRARAPATRR